MKINKNILIMIFFGILLAGPVLAVTWTANNSIGDGAFGDPVLWGDWRLSPEFFEWNDELFMIAGEYYMTAPSSWFGWKWDGDSWEDNSTITTNLIDFGYAGHPTVWEMGGNLYLLVGEWYSMGYGFHWNGAGWTANSTVNASLSNPTHEYAPEAFTINGNVHLVVGQDNGAFTGWSWNGAGWTSNSTIISGLTSVDDIPTPDVFEMNGETYLITGMNDSSYDGYKWNGAGWTSNSTIISGLPAVTNTSNGVQSSPTVIKMNEKYYLISGENTGLFDGFTADATDTCSYDEYSKVDWDVDCSDNCAITSAVDLKGNSISITGTGTFSTTVSISNFLDLIITGVSSSSRCTATCNGGCFSS